MCFGKHTKKRNERMEKAADGLYGKKDNPIRKLKKKLRCIQTCGIVWLFLAIILIAVGGTLLYFFISFLNSPGVWQNGLTYTGIAATSLGGLMLILGIITLICFCTLVKKQQSKLSGKPQKMKQGASLQKQYPVGTYPAQKDYKGEGKGHLPPIDQEELSKDKKKKKKKKKKQVDPEMGYEVNADTEHMIRPDHHGGVHSGRMDLLNDGPEDSIQPQQSHVAHSAPAGSGIYEDPDVVVHTHRSQVHAEPMMLDESIGATSVASTFAANEASFADREAAAHSAKQQYVESQARQRERDAYERGEALEEDWRDYEANQDGRKMNYLNQGQSYRHPVIPPLKGHGAPQHSSGYPDRKGQMDVSMEDDHVYAEVNRGVHAAAHGVDAGLHTSKQRRSPPHYGKHSRVSPAPQEHPMAMHAGPTKSTHHTSQEVQGADIPMQPIIQHQPQFLPFGVPQTMMTGQPEMPYKIFMVAPANAGQPMMMPYQPMPYYPGYMQPMQPMQSMQPMQQSMPMMQPIMTPMYGDPNLMKQQGVTQPPTYQQVRSQAQDAHQTLGRLESEEGVVPTVEEVVHAAPTMQLHSAPPPGDHMKQKEKQYGELDAEALSALDEFQRVIDMRAEKVHHRSPASSVNEEPLEQTKESNVESAIDMDEMLRKLDEMDTDTITKSSTQPQHSAVEMAELEGIMASSQQRTESVDPLTLSDGSDIEEKMQETHEAQVESAIDIDAMLQKLDEMDSKGQQSGGAVAIDEVDSEEEKGKKMKKKKKKKDEESGDEKKKKKKKFRKDADDGEEDDEIDTRKKKKKKDSKEEEGSENEEKKAKKKKKKKKGSEEEEGSEEEKEKKSKKGKKDKKKDKKKSKDHDDDEEEVIAATSLAVVEHGVSLDELTESYDGYKTNDDHLDIHLHGQPDPTERAMKAKLEILEKRVHFVEESLHRDSDEEVIESTRSLKIEHSPPQADADMVIPDSAYMIESSPPQADADMVVPDYAYTIESSPPQADADMVVQDYAYTIESSPPQADADMVIPDSAYMIESVPPQADADMVIQDSAYTIESAPPQADADMVVPDSAYMIESAPLEHPLPALRHSWNETTVQEMDSDDDDIVMPVKTKPHVRPTASHRVTFRKESEELVMPEQSAAVETTPSGVGDLLLDDVDGFEDVITVEKTSVEETAPPGFDEMILSSRVPAIVIEEVVQTKSEDAIVMEAAPAVESAPFILDGEDSISIEAAPVVESAPLVLEGEDSIVVEAAPVVESAPLVLEGEDSIVMDVAPAVESAPLVLDGEVIKAQPGPVIHHNDTSDTVKDDEAIVIEAALVVEEAPLAESAPFVFEGEDSIVMEAAPAVESAPLVLDGEDSIVMEAAPAVESAPLVLDGEDSIVMEVAPAVESAPLVIEGEDSIVIEAAPAVESAPLVLEGEDSIVIEAASAIESAPLVLEDEDSIVIEAAPAIESAPLVIEGEDSIVIEAAPAVESAPFVLEAQSRPVIHHNDTSKTVEDEGEMVMEAALVVEEAPLAESAPLILDAEVNVEEDKSKKKKTKKVKKEKKEKKEKKTKTKKKKKTDEDNDFGMLAPIYTRFTPRLLDGGTTPEPKETPDDLDMSSIKTKAETAIDEVDSFEITHVVEASPIILNAELDEGENVAVAPSCGFEEVLTVENVANVEHSVDMWASDDDEVIVVATPTSKEKNSPSKVERSFGVLDLKSASDDDQLSTGQDTTEAASGGVEEVLKIETVSQVETSVDMFDFDDEFVKAPVAEMDNDTTHVAEDVVVVQSITQVEHSVDMLDLKGDASLTPPIGRKGKTTDLDKKVDILIIGDNKEKDLIFADTSQIPEKDTMEIETGVIPITVDGLESSVTMVDQVPGSKDDAADSANGSLQSFIVHEDANNSDLDFDHVVKVRSDPVSSFPEKEETILLRRQSQPATDIKLESAQPVDNDTNSLDDFFGNSDVTQLLGGDDDQPKKDEQDFTMTNMRTSRPPLRFGATRAQHNVSEDVHNGITDENKEMSPPTGRKSNDTFNDFLNSDRRKLKRDSLDDGGFWDKRKTSPRRGRRERGTHAQISEHPELNGNTSPSIGMKTHNSTNGDSEPLAIPSGGEENDSVDGALFGENDAIDLMQTMKRTRDSDFNTTAFVSKGENSAVTEVKPFKVESDSEEDILSPMIRKSKKKTFMTEA